MFFSIGQPYHRRSSIANEIVISLHFTVILDYSVPMSFEKIKKDIQALGLSQRQVAAQMELSPAYFSQCLSGKRPAPASFEERVLISIAILDRASKAGKAAFDQVVKGGRG